MIPHLGERMAQLRQARGWTREELAAKLGTTSEYVRHLEKGHHGMRRPSFEMITSVARVFDLTTEDLTRADWPLTEQPDATDAAAVALAS